jgi:hypothetical protein
MVTRAPSGRHELVAHGDTVRVGCKDCFISISCMLRVPVPRQFVDTTAACVQGR